jgi:hypothetical protein
MEWLSKGESNQSEIARIFLLHNPAAMPVLFKKKIAIGLPGERPGPVSRYFDAKLGPDEAFEIDRKDIFAHANANLEFIKGFVIIESDVELDVLLYTLQLERLT